MSETQGAGWLLATGSPCEEEQRGFLVTLTAPHLLWGSLREKGSQASTLLPGVNPFDAEFQRSPGPQKTVCTDLPH